MIGIKIYTDESKIYPFIYFLFVHKPNWRGTDIEKN